MDQDYVAPMQGCLSIKAGWTRHGTKLSPPEPLASKRHGEHAGVIELASIAVVSKLFADALGSSRHS